MVHKHGAQAWLQATALGKLCPNGPTAPACVAAERVGWEFRSSWQLSTAEGEPLDVQVGPPVLLRLMNS